MCTKWPVKRLYSPSGICFDEKLRRCAAPARSFFRSPCFGRACKQDFFFLSAGCARPHRKQLLPLLSMQFLAQTAGTIYTRPHFLQRRFFSVLFDCSDIDLLRLTGFLKNLPVGQEGRYLQLYKITPEELPDFEKLRPVRIADYIPEWRRLEEEKVREIRERRTTQRGSPPPATSQQEYRQPPKREVNSSPVRESVQDRPLHPQREEMPVYTPMRLIREDNRPRLTHLSRPKPQVQPPVSARSEEPPAAPPPMPPRKEGAPVKVDPPQTPPLQAGTPPTPSGQCRQPKNLFKNIN